MCKSVTSRSLLDPPVWPLVCELAAAGTGLATGTMVALIADVATTCACCSRRCPPRSGNRRPNRRRTRRPPTKRSVDRHCPRACGLPVRRPDRRVRVQIDRDGLASNHRPLGGRTQPHRTSRRSWTRRQTTTGLRASRPASRSRRVTVSSHRSSRRRPV